MDFKNIIICSAILIASHPCPTLASGSDSWTSYSDGSTFKDVLNGRSYEDAFGDPYDSLFSSSLTSDSYGGSYTPQEKSTVRVIQQRSDSDYGQSSGTQRYNSPAVTVRSGQRSGSSYGSNTQSFSGSKGYSQPKTRPSTKGGYSGGGSSYTKPSYSSKTTQPQQQQQTDSDYDSTGYSDIPETGFQCLNKVYGYYADVSANCQIFHVCQPDGQKWSFWCPNGTLYHQKVQTCDWWYNVDCPSSADYYFLNERIGVLPPQDATLHRYS